MRTKEEGTKTKTVIVADFYTTKATKSTATRIAISDADGTYDLTTLRLDGTEKDGAPRTIKGVGTWSIAKQEIVFTPEKESTAKEARIDYSLTTFDGLAAKGSISIQLESFGVISGVLFHDKDDDERYDKNEDGIDDVTVRLMTSIGSIYTQTETDNDGWYTFTEIPPDEYTVDIKLSDKDLSKYKLSVESSHVLNGKDTVRMDSGEEYKSKFGFILKSISSTITQEEQSRPMTLAKTGGNIFTTTRLYISELLRSLWVE